MSKPVIRPGTLEDAIDLAPRLRPEDALELTLSSGKDVTQTLISSFRLSSECFAAEEDGKVIAIGGFSTCLYGDEGTVVGIPWLVGSPEMMKHPVTLVAAGHVAVERWMSQCEVMCNITHVDNHIHHKWLKHLGFKFMPEVVLIGPEKAPFLQFYRHLYPCANQ